MQLWYGSQPIGHDNRRFQSEKTIALTLLWISPPLAPIVNASLAQATAIFPSPTRNRSTACLYGV